MTQLTDYIPEDIDQLNDIPEMDISQMISQNPDPQLWTPQPYTYKQELL